MDDLVILAHIREQHRLSLQSYGRPRMAEERQDLAICILDMAVALRQPPKDCSHHTDRGSQYCSNECQKRLNKHSFKVSMNGKGNCYDCEYGIAA